MPWRQVDVMTERFLKRFVTGFVRSSRSDRHSGLRDGHGSRPSKGPRDLLAARTEAARSTAESRVRRW